MKVKFKVKSEYALDHEGKRITAIVLKAAGKAEEDAAEKLAGGITSTEDEDLLRFGRAAAEIQLKLCLVGYERAGEGGKPEAVACEVPYEAFDGWSGKARAITRAYDAKLNGGGDKKEIDEGFKEAQVV